MASDLGTQGEKHEQKSEVSAGKEEKSDRVKIAVDALPIAHNDRLVLVDNTRPQAPSR